VGLPWLHNAKSGLLFGVAHDAAHLATAIDRQSRQRRAREITTQYPIPFREATLSSLKSRACDSREEQHRRRRSEQVLPTPLTHRRKSEGRGNQFRLRVKPAVRPPKICEMCGTEGLKSRYCRSCAVEASRETMAQVALLGHARPKSKKTKTRISKVLSDHAAGNTWWDPKSLPAQRKESSRHSGCIARLAALCCAHPFGPAPSASEALGGIGTTRGRVVAWG